MKLDQITDIEILRNELKKHMIKCIKDFTCKNYNDKTVEFKAGEYYYITQESDWTIIYMIALKILVPM